MNIRSIIPAVLVVAALVAPTAAQAGTGRVCKSANLDGAHLEVTASEGASCSMAMATMRAGYRNDWPRTLRVYSPVTHRTYRMHRVSLVGSSSGSYFSAMYDGPGFSVGVSVEA